MRLLIPARYDARRRNADLVLGAIGKQSDLINSRDAKRRRASCRYNNALRCYEQKFGNASARNRVFRLAASLQRLLIYMPLTVTEVQTTIQCRRAGKRMTAVMR